MNFAVVAPDATAVDLSLFEHRAPGAVERRVPMYRGAEGVWHLYVESVGPGQAYGFRANGPYDPRSGHLFNPAKLLLDPRALAVSGEVVWHPALVTDRDKSLGRGEGPCPVDSAPYCPRSLVVDTRFDWQSDAPPRIPWRDTVLYECHVRGLTRLHPEVPESHRGRFAGLADPAVIDHLLGLGVTTVELMPVQQFASERHLQEADRANYWGYNPLAPMSPHAAYASSDDGSQVDEFRNMVRRLHAAGLEVVLDIVFNHTAEGGLAGPTLSLRGLANALYYRHDASGAYEDFSGCGNTLDLRRAPVRRWVLDTLRHWVAEMHVDGFRLDLAPILARDSPDFETTAPFFEELAADPQLAAVKWIAEPWDLGPEGYQLGAFPAPFAEWNDRFRDAARAVWRGDRGRLDELALRLAGSPDIFAEDRGRQASVNFVTAHDGFTLADLTAYECRNNHANGEGNRDGHPHTLSRNWGAEGPSADLRVRHLRQRARRNLVATLALAEGVPMLLHGDELGRTQGGNNNAYCQDNATSWVAWSAAPEDDSFLAFVERVFALRRRLLQGGDAALAWRPLRGGEAASADPEGRHASGDPDSAAEEPTGWDDDDEALALRLVGSPGDSGGPLLLLNGAGRSRSFRLGRQGASWRVGIASFDTADGPIGDAVRLPPHSLMVLEPQAPDA